MRCHEVRRLIPFYVDHELSDEDMREVEAHVSECPECAVYLREEREMKEALSSLENVTVPASLEESVMSALRREQRRWLYRKVSIAAGVMGVVAVAFAVGFHRGEEHHPELSPSLMENLVVEHECPAPSDMGPKADPRTVARTLGQQTGLYVEPYVPVSWGALEGSRVTHFKGRRAIQFSYRYKGRRVTLMVFDPGLMASVPRLSSVQQLRQSPDRYMVKTPGGRNVVLFRNGSLGYSVISDLDRDDTMEFVSHVLNHR